MIKRKLWFERFGKMVRNIKIAIAYREMNLNRDHSARSYFFLWFFDFSHLFNVWEYKRLFSYFSRLHSNDHLERNSVSWLKIQKFDPTSSQFSFLGVFMTWCFRSEYLIVYWIFYSFWHKEEIDIYIMKYRKKYFSIALALICGFLLGFFDCCINSMIYPYISVQFEGQTKQAFALSKFFHVSFHKWSGSTFFGFFSRLSVPFVCFMDQCSQFKFNCQFYLWEP